MSHGRHTTMVIIGGWSMVIFSILFVGITLLIDSLAQAQQMLYGLEQHNLFKVAAGSNTIRTLLVVYAILPLLIIPGAVGAFYIFSDKYEFVIELFLHIFRHRPLLFWRKIVLLARLHS